MKPAIFLLRLIYLSTKDNSSSSEILLESKIPKICGLDSPAYPLSIERNCLNFKFSYPFKPFCYIVHHRAG